MRKAQVFRLDTAFEDHGVSRVDLVWLRKHGFSNRVRALYLVPFETGGSTVRCAKVFLFVLAVLIAGCGTSNVEPVDHPILKGLGYAPEAIRESAAAVVRVSVPDSSGTGFFVSDSGLMVTNFHVLGSDVCAREGCYLSVDFDYELGKQSRKEAILALPLSSSRELDVAVFQLWKQRGIEKLSTPSFLNLSESSTANLADSIHLVGHPKSALKKWSRGSVVDRVGAFFYGNNYSLPGNSGSPYLDDAGRVFGIHHRSRSDRSRNTRSIGTHVSHFRDLIEQARGLSDSPSGRSENYFSTGEQVSESQAVERNKIYLNGIEGRPNVAGRGRTRHFLEILANACDEGLRNPDRDSRESAYRSTWACREAALWIDGFKRPTEAIAPLRAIEGAERQAWKSRFEAFYALSKSFYDNWYSWITTQIVRLYPSFETGVAQGGDSWRQELNVTQPELDFYLASFLVRMANEDPNKLKYKGVDVREFVSNYEDTHGYQQSFSAIISGIEGLYHSNFIDDDKTVELFQKILRDPKVDIDGFLQAEETAYRLGLMQ